jgi:hypothetical protein
MTTKATSGQKVQFERGDGATTEVFTKVAEITSFTGPSRTAKEIDVTSVDSDAMEYIAGVMDAGEVSIEGNYVGSDAAQQGLQADLTNRVRRNFKFLLNDPTTPSTGAPTTIAFAAVVKSFGIKGGVNAKIDFTCALRITGVPTITYPT